MRHTRHATGHPKPTPTQPARETRPRGVQGLSRKTWDKVRAAIRALQATSTPPP
ncbi:MAG: hypothetical protein AB1730_25865 [Myxococcota bacterium]|jgi:hypothetical protein